MKANKYTVALEICDIRLGEVHGAGEYKEGKQVSIFAVAKDGYAFDGWYDGEKLITYQSEYSFIMLAKAVLFTARFRIEINQNFNYTLLNDGKYSLDSVKNRSITTINIPDYFSVIGDIDCYNLYEVHYNGTLAQWCSMSGLDNLFSHCYQDYASLYIAGEEITGTLVIPEGVTNIANGAFNKCRALTSITIPDSVTSIGDYAFYACDNITSINIPNSVISIGGGAFSACKRLTRVTLPNHLTVIGSAAFSYCDRLTNISIPESVRKIGRYAFYYCASLKSITIPSSVIIISDGTFGHCHSLSDISLPNCLMKIGMEAFYNCKSLISITIPNCVISINDWAFSNCKSLAKITIGSNMMNIGSGAFYNCNSLYSIAIPNRVVSIGMEAFTGCEKLSSVTLEKLSDWYVAKSENGLDSNNINTSDASQNATYLTDVYKSHFWKRK